MKKSILKKVFTRELTIIIPFATLFFLSCENDEYLYKGSDSIWLSGDPAQEAKEDSVLYSFNSGSSTTITLSAPCAMTSCALSVIFEPNRTPTT